MNNFSTAQENNSEADLPTDRFSLMSSQLEQRVSSQIRRTVCEGHVVYQKQYVTNDWDDDEAVVRKRAWREVKLLQQIGASDQFGGRLGVVRVASADPDAATIATFEIAGSSLGQLILADNTISTKLMPWYLAGRWIRQFQSIALSEEASQSVSKKDPNDIVAYCDFRLRSLADYNYAWPNETLRTALLQRIADLRDQCQASELNHVWVHADYAPGNLMWDGRILTPIDFAMVRRGQPLEDATYLIHRIEMHSIYRPWLRLPVAAIRRAILRGLGVSTADQSAAYQMLMLKHQICRLHTYVRRPASSFKQALHDRWVRSVLRRRLQQATKKSLT